MYLATYIDSVATCILTIPVHVSWLISVMVDSYRYLIALSTLKQELPDQ